MEKRFAGVYDGAGEDHTVDANGEERQGRHYQLSRVDPDALMPQMRSREHYDEKLSYVRMNPVRKELVKTPDDWPYQGVIHDIAWM